MTDRVGIEGAKEVAVLQVKRTGAKICKMVSRAINKIRSKVEGRLPGNGCKPPK
jgi:hypothetical protein